MIPENSSDSHLQATREWVEKFVIGLNLCPFAAPVAAQGRIRYALSEARDIDVLYQDLLRELDHLIQVDPETVETTILVHPWVLNDFEEYLDFLEIVDEAIEEAELDGILQVASFHPEYQFEGPPADDPSHRTNRSPYPMLHILREASLTIALDNYPDPEMIPERNIAKMREMFGNGMENG